MTLSQAVAGVPQAVRTTRSVPADAEIIPFPLAERSANVAGGRVGRRVGAHREPGSNPWRTGLREMASFLTFGLWTPWAYRPGG